ncbi:MAG: LOG family protein [Bacteroidales bacterium]|nr:LOG family protein [Bacteroidales bacterium]
MIRVTVFCGSSFGTMEEFFEMLTWGQLGLHKKPVAILNINGYFDSLIAFIQTMVDSGFYVPPAVSKWILKEKA